MGLISLKAVTQSSPQTAFRSMARGVGGNDTFTHQTQKLLKCKIYGTNGKFSISSVCMSRVNKNLFL